MYIDLLRYLKEHSLFPWQPLIHWMPLILCDTTPPVKIAWRKEGGRGEGGGGGEGRGCEKVYIYMYMYI